MSIGSGIAVAAMWVTLVGITLAVPMIGILGIIIAAGVTCVVAATGGRP